MNKQLIILLPFIFFSCAHISGGEARREIASGDSSTTFVPIHAGSFDMGSPEAEYGRMSEETLHHVSITHDFEMQATPVTQIQYRQVMQMNPSNFRHQTDCPLEYDKKYFLCPNYPVETLDWYQVQNFIKALNAKKDGYLYRLPTAAEWEYAARAGSSTVFSFGDDVDELGKHAWYYENSRQQTHPVGKKLPNAWGLYDMLGNVREWVADFPSTYKAEFQVDPIGSQDGDQHEIRGCSWGNFATECRSAARSNDTTLSASSSNGFRLVRTKAP